MNRAPSHRATRGIGFVVGLLGLAGIVSAESVVPPHVSVPWVIESADYTGDVKDQITRLEARYTIRVIRDGWVEIPLALQGATITAIEIERKPGEAHIVPRGGGYVLAASKKGAYKVRVTCSNLLVQDSQFEGVYLTIPQATFSTMTLFVPRKDVELRPTEQLYVERKPDASRDGVTLIARLGAAGQIDLRWRTKPTAPVQIEPVLYGEVHTLVTIEEQLARLTSIVEYRMAQGETRTLTIHLPDGVNLLNVRGAGIEDWRVAEAQGDKTLTVSLNFPLKDATYRLVLEGEQPIAAQSADYTMPELRLVGAKQERGYLAVSRSGSIELAAQTMEGINRVDVRELPDLLKGAMGSPALLAFKYHQHPYQVVIGLTRHEDHAVLAAIAERGELVTVLSRQGELLTRATYLIKANKKQFLEVALPDGATLWSCLVAGRSVKPVEGQAGKLLIPLDGATDSVQSVPVELVYFERRSGLTGVGRLTLRGPILDVPTTVANWSVFAPRDVKFLRMSGNLERGAAPFEFVDEPFIQVASAAEAPMSQAVMVMQEREDRKNWKGWLIAKRARVGTGGARYASHDALEEPQDQSVVGFALSTNASVTPSTDEQFAGMLGDLGGRLQESGILPLKIHLPKSGDLYRFNRLMTSQEALEIDATFVHIRMPWVMAGLAGFAALGIAAMASIRLRRA
ncbi:MAG: hypothetical protein HY599_00205 [Candidatus Omnitrophica bacterium]|nr:hypothetical protein [Candidatus Omnitrophota bacterium]